MADRVQEDSENRPLAALEFEVSRVVQRLEANVSVGGAGASAGAAAEDAPSRKISSDFFEPLETSIDEILRSVEWLVRRTEPAEESGDAWSLPAAGRLVRASALAHSVVAYLGVLERSHLAKINTHVAAETTRWLTHMFRFAEYSAYYHYDHLEGLVKVTRMMLHYKYPRYLEDGALALTNKLPCIYSSVASPLGVVQHLCRQLGLPLACIRPVPVNSVFGSNQTMDVAALQKLLAEDAECESREPLMVLADAGTTTLGHSDSVARLNELCRAHHVWLHLRGHTLAALAILPPRQPHLPQQPPHSQKIADSVTLTLGTWFGIPGLPVVTLYRIPEPPANEHTRTVSTVNSTREGTLPLLGGLAGSEHQARRVPCFPLWCCVRAAGHAALVRKLSAAFHSCYLLHRLLADMPAVRILSKTPGGEGGAISLNDLTTKPIDVSLLLEVVVPCVVFQFAPPAQDGTALPTRIPPYYDKLNSWLGQILQREVEQIMVDICETEQYGAVIRYCPLESSAEGWSDEPLSQEQLAAVADCLQQQLDILRATVALKETFAAMVQHNPVLRLVDIPGWAGLGGVRYVPLGWESLPPEQTRDELNTLNRALVDALKTTDSAFSCGEGVDSMACVRFGMVTADTDVEELLSLVVSVGHEVEEQSKVLDTMTEIVKKGIEAATADLQRESEERLWQEGLLRRVPVVGRVVDWWSPPPAVGLRGRCLHLSQGTVESTENIYKYHMQIPAGTVPHGVSVSRAPPPAEVQTAVGPPLSLPSSQSHSRSSSHAGCHPAA